MRLIYYPFKNVNFTQKTSIFLDACFLLALLDDYDTKYNLCNTVANKLINQRCQLYLSPIVSAEVINKLMISLFIKDLTYKIENIKPLNKTKNIQIIIDFFPTHEKNIITNNLKTELRKINFKKRFNKIYKAGNSKLLEVYFQKAVELEKILESKLHIKCVSLNKQTVINARDYIATNQMGVNDAFHLSITVQNNIDYLLTLDKDFKRLKSNNSKVSILKI